MDLIRKLAISAYGTKLAFAKGLLQCAAMGPKKPKQSDCRQKVENPNTHMLVVVCQKETSSKIRRVDPSPGLPGHVAMEIDLDWPVLQAIAKDVIDEEAVRAKLFCSYGNSSVEQRE